MQRKLQDAIVAFGYAHFFPKEQWHPSNYRLSFSISTRCFPFIYSVFNSTENIFSVLLAFLRAFRKTASWMASKIQWTKTKEVYLWIASSKNKANTYGIASPMGTTSTSLIFNQKKQIGQN